MIEKLVGALLGAPAEQVAEYFKEKQRLKQELKLETIKGKIADKKARASFADKRAEEAHTWGMAHIANSGWKDEFVLLALYGPAISAFIPGLGDNALAGFAILGKMPLWYQTLLVTISLAIYGIRAYQGKNVVGRLIGSGEKTNG